MSAGRFDGKLTTWGTIAGPVVTGLGVALAFAALGASIVNFTDGASQSAIAQSEAEVIRLEVRQLEAQVREMAPTVALIRRADQSGNPELRALAAQIADVARRQSRLEGIILRDPARALEMPLLQRDLQTARETTKAEMDGIRSAVDRLYTLIGGIALALVGIFITNLIVARKRSET